MSKHATNQKYDARWRARRKSINTPDQTIYVITNPDYQEFGPRLVAASEYQLDTFYLSGGYEIIAAYRNGEREL